MEEKHKPRKLTIKEKYSILGKLSDSQRQFVGLVIINSAKGKWTTYNDAKEFGVQSPDKRMSEVQLIDGIDLKMRHGKRVSDIGRTPMEVAF